MEGGHTLLVPNFGADEGADWQRFANTPAVSRIGQLWRLLFASGNQFCGSDTLDESWPEALGPRPVHAVFPWLDGLPAAAWLAEATAHRLISQRGLKLAAAEPDVVLAVHDKAFALASAQELDEVPRCLRDLCQVYSPSDLADADALLRRLRSDLARWPEWTGGSFTLKPRLGGSGRGRVGGQSGRLDSDAIGRALPRLAERAGALLEPWLDRVRDLSVVMHLAKPGTQGEPEVTLLGSLAQRVSSSGVYLGHLGEIDSRGRVFSGAPEDEAMRTAAAAIAVRARDAGYHGPCGLDGFVFRLADHPDAAPRDVLRPIVELNARFTAGTVVVGLIRRALHRVKQSLSISPSERIAFLFCLECPDAWTSWESFRDALGERVLLLPLGPESDERGPALLFSPSLEEIHARLGDS